MGESGGREGGAGWADTYGDIQGQARERCYVQEVCEAAGSLVMGVRRGD